MQACINSDGNVVVSTPDASMKVKIHLNDPDFFRVEWWGTTADCYDLANLLIQFANQYSQDL